MNEITTVLTKARKIIEDPKHWVQGSYARGNDGLAIAPYSKEAVCWCSVGAVDKVLQQYGFSYKNPMYYLANAAMKIDNSQTNLNVATMKIDNSQTNLNVATMKIDNSQTNLNVATMTRKVISFNDRHQHKVVLKMFDMAIKEAKRAKA